MRGKQKNSDDGFRGRGVTSNPANRFEQREYERLGDFPEEERAPRTQFLRDASKSIIARNDSPDINFEASINPYRGCEHGCAYCYARPFHEFLGFSAGLDFETRILVKENASTLLRKELSAPSWRPTALALSGVTDPWQPIERELEITRRCLEVLRDFRNPVQAVTKNALVTRDADLLAELAQYNAASVLISIPTADADLARELEPRTSTPERRFRAMRQLSDAGIPVGISLSPVIPALTDSEIPTLLEEAAANGASYAVFVPLRLPRTVAELFSGWLQRFYPDRKEKVLSRVRQMRSGALNDERYVSRMQGEGVYAEQLSALFRTASRKHGISTTGPALATSAFRRLHGDQLPLFP
ncbi:PA0069 family radical SAM protein [bacterium]|nr:PA0069 family radical SAM protein [bacterium]